MQIAPRIFINDKINGIKGKNINISSLGKVTLNKKGVKELNKALKEN